MNNRFVLIVSLFLFFVLVSCGDDPVDEPENNAGKVIIHFDHTIDNQPIIFDSLMYTNAAGNPYLVNEIQYFISDVSLYYSDGNIKIIDDWKDIHYVDTDIPSTWKWEVYDDIPAVKYDSISFVFGFTEEKNQSFMFVNSPEKDMFWPEYLGGGYHYLKLNGKWKPEGQTQTLPFNFHLGIGQIYYEETDSIVGFVQNYFRVSLPESGFSVSEGSVTNITFRMNVERWFLDPHIYNHDEFGGDIMQKQEAMQLASENGWNVFTFDENLSIK
jgi:hypothetical protein